METPIYSRLSDYHKKGRISFAMPGHKNLRGLVPDLQQCDVTELMSTVDLHHEDEYVNKANKLLSDTYKSDHSFIMTGGSTAGVQTMVSTVLKPGDTLLVSSDCHMSVINTCAICGYKLRMIPVKMHAKYCIPMTVECDFDIPSDVRAVLITSPNYYGITKDIRAIAQKCHKAGIPLLVDEAHGAHFIADSRFPETAIEQGADMSCQSAHKTLNALTGAAYLHVKSERIDVKRVKKMLASFQSSSPSYPIAASADAARAVLSETDYSAIINECDEFKKALRCFTSIEVVGNDDPLRIVLSFVEYDISGFEVNTILSERYGIDVEMADLYNIVLIATPWNMHSDFITLFNALRDIIEDLSSAKYKMIEPPPCNSGIIEPYSGWYGETEYVSLDSAVGRRSSGVIASYPPGTAIIVTGAVIDREQTEYIKSLKKAGAEITGIIDDKIEVVR